MQVNKILLQLLLIFTFTSDKLVKLAIRAYFDRLFQVNFSNFIPRPKLILLSQVQ